MNKINLLAIAVGEPIFVVITYFMQFPITGIMGFMILAVILYVIRNLMKSLDTTDKGKNSYEYLNSFNTWLKLQLSIMGLISLGFLLYLWFLVGITSN